MLSESTVSTYELHHRRVFKLRLLCACLVLLLSGKILKLCLFPGKYLRKKKIVKESNFLVFGFHIINFKEDKI